MQPVASVVSLNRSVLLVTKSNDFKAYEVPRKYPTRATVAERERLIRCVPLFHGTNHILFNRSKIELGRGRHT
jgi:hypothetical protein